MTGDKRMKKYVEVAGVRNEKVYDLIKNKEVSLNLEEEVPSKGSFMAKTSGLFRLELVDAQRDLESALAAMRNSLKLLEHSTREKHFKNDCIIVFRVVLEWVEEGIKVQNTLSFVFLNTDQIKKGPNAGTMEILKKYLRHCAISEEIDAASQIHRESMLTTLLRPSLHEESSISFIGVLSTSNYSSCVETTGIFEEIKEKLRSLEPNNEGLAPKSPKGSLRSRSRERLVSGSEAKLGREETRKSLVEEVEREENQRRRLEEINKELSEKEEKEARKAQEEEMNRREIIKSIQQEKEMEVQMARAEFEATKEKRESFERASRNSSVCEAINDLETQIEKLYDQTVSISPLLTPEEKKSLLMNLEYKATRLSNFVKKLGYDDPEGPKGNQEFLSKLNRARELLAGFQRETKEPTRSETRRTNRSRNQEAGGFSIKEPTAQLDEITPAKPESAYSTNIPPRRSEKPRNSSSGKGSNGSLTPQTPMIFPQPVQFQLQTPNQLDLKKNLSDNLTKIAFLEENMKVKDGLIRTLEGQLKRAQQELGALQGEVHILREKELVYVKNEEVFRNALQEMEEEMAKGHTKKGKLDQRITKIQEDLTSELEMMALAKRETEIKLEEVLKELEEDSRKGKGLEELLKAERVENERLNEAVRNTEKKARETIDQLLYQVEFLTQKNNEIQIEKDSLSLRLENSEEQLRTAIAKRNKTKTKNQSDFLRAIEEQTQIAQRKSAKCKELKKAVKELEKQIKEEKDDYARMKIENEKANIIKANYTGDVEKLKSELMETKRELEFRTKDHEKIKTETSESKRDLKELLEREQKLLNEIKEYERGIRIYEEKFLEAQNEIQADIQIMNQLKAENKQLKEDLEAQKRVNIQLEIELKGLEDSQSKVALILILAYKFGNISQKKQEIDKLERKVEDFFRESSAVKEENIRLKSKESELNKENTRLIDEVDELRTQSQDDKSTIKMLKTQIKEVKQSIETIIFDGNRLKRGRNQPFKSQFKGSYCLKRVHRAINCKTSSK